MMCWYKSYLRGFRNIRLPRRSRHRTPATTHCSSNEARRQEKTCRVCFSMTMATYSTSFKCALRQRLLLSTPNTCSGIPQPIWRPSSLTLSTGILARSPGGSGWSQSPVSRTSRIMVNYVWMCAQWVSDSIGAPPNA